MQTDSAAEFAKASRQDLADKELVELIAENGSMSKTLAEYGGQKSTSQPPTALLVVWPSSWATRW